MNINSKGIFSKYLLINKFAIDDLSNPEFKVLYYIYENQNSEGWTEINYTELAYKCKISEISARRHIKKLLYEEYIFQDEKRSNLFKTVEKYASKSELKMTEIELIKTYEECEKYFNNSKECNQTYLLSMYILYFCSKEDGININKLLEITIEEMYLAVIEEMARRYYKVLENKNNHRMLKNIAGVNNEFWED